MSFTECVVIPIDTYRRKCESKGTGANILSQNIPSDLKMKLFDQEKQLAASRKNNNGDGSSWVLNQFSITEKPVVRKILENFIEVNRHVISYNPQSLQIIIEGSEIPNSNFVKSLRWLLGADLVHSSTNPPPGALQLREKLFSLGVPVTWLRSDTVAVPHTSETKMFTDQHPELSFYRPGADSAGSAESLFHTTSQSSIPEMSTTPGTTVGVDTSPETDTPSQIKANQTPLKRATARKPIAQSTPIPAPSPEMADTVTTKAVVRKHKSTAPALSKTAVVFKDTPEAESPSHRRWGGVGRGKKKLDYSHRYPGDDWVTEKPRSKGKQQTGAGYWVF